MVTMGMATMDMVTMADKKRIVQTSPMNFVGEGKITTITLAAYIIFNFCNFYNISSSYFDNS